MAQGNSGNMVAKVLSIPSPSRRTGHEDSGLVQIDTAEPSEDTSANWPKSQDVNPPVNDIYTESTEISESDPIQEEDLSSDTSVHNSTPLPDIFKVTGLLRNIKQRARLTSSQSADLQDCIQILSDHSCEKSQPQEPLKKLEFSVQSHDKMAGGELVVHEIPVLRHARRLKLRVSLTMEEQKKFKKIEMKTLQTAVIAIYKHDCYSMSSREPDEFSLIQDGFFSIALVVGAIGKVMCLAEPRDADAGSDNYIKWFLQEISEEKKAEIPNPTILTGIRNSLVHGNCYLSEVRKVASGDTNFILYQRNPTVAKFAEVYRCSSQEFTIICAKMRKLFLSWAEISPYIPKDRDEKEAETETGR